MVTVGVFDWQSKIQRTAAFCRNPFQTGLLAKFFPQRRDRSGGSDASDGSVCWA